MSRLGHLFYFNCDGWQLYASWWCYPMLSSSRNWWPSYCRTHVVLISCVEIFPVFVSLLTLSYVRSIIWSFWCIFQWSGVTLLDTHWSCTYLLWSSGQDLFQRGMMIRSWIRNLKKLMLSSHNLWNKQMIVPAFSELPVWITMELYLIGGDDILESIGWYSYFLDEWKIHWPWRRIKCWSDDAMSVRQSFRLAIRPGWHGMCVKAFLHSCTTGSSGGSFSGYGGCLESHTIPHRRL